MHGSAEQVLGQRWLHRNPVLKKKQASQQNPLSEQRGQTEEPQPGSGAIEWGFMTLIHCKFVSVYHDIGSGTEDRLKDNPIEIRLSDGNSQILPSLCCLY